MRWSNVFAGVHVHVVSSGPLYTLSFSFLSPGSTTTTLAALATSATSDISCQMCPSSSRRLTHLPNNMQFDPESLFIPDHNLSYVTVEADHVMLSSPTRFDRQPSPEQGAYISPSAPSASAPESTESQDCDHLDWSPPSPVTLSPLTSDSSSGSQDSDTFHPVKIHIDIQAHLPLPASSPGYLTYTQQQAMANRVPYDLLVPGGDLDPYRYTPVFLHDTLMLPGSLATLIGKVRHLD